MIVNKGGFSWRRFLGLSRLKAAISRKIGVPLTRSGRERKLGVLIMRFFTWLANKVRDLFTH